jgi:selenide,water dikinase
MGAELTLGFTVTGTLAGQACAIDGARDGDVILLTRLIGSGTLLAADMAGMAKGRDVIEAIDVMSTPQGDAAAIVTPFAHAMTDVTGFGLAGHLSRMARASHLTAFVSLADLPIFQGAEDLARRGIRSSLFTNNRADVAAQVANVPRGALMFDPQTAGGFLVALPEKDAKACLGQLVDLGHSAALIGRFEAPASVDVRAE